jgi:hypothetical protein
MSTFDTSESTAMLQKEIYNNTRMASYNTRIHTQVLWLHNTDIPNSHSKQYCGFNDFRKLH